MKWLLDTNIISFAMRGHPTVRSQLAAIPREQVMTSMIVVAEGLAGVHLAPHRPALKTMWETIIATMTMLPFDLACARRYGELRAELEKRGQMIGTHDCEIASTALAWQDNHPGERLTVVTDNEKDFARVHGLRLVNWMEHEKKYG